MKYTLNNREIESARNLYGDAYIADLETLIGSPLVEGSMLDVSDPAFLKLRSKYRSQRRKRYSSRQRRGPGTELKKLLKRIGIDAKPGCLCNARAAVMDRNGCDWCEANQETIVDWLQEEATKRKLPFIRLAGYAIIKLAIRKARKLNHDKADAAAQAGDG